MRIGILGSGNIGATAAELFARAGHEVVVANSRGPESLADLVGRLGPSARAATVLNAVQDSELVLVALPVRAYGDLPQTGVSGKVVIDAGNYYPPRDGSVPELADGTTTSSELLAARLPGARVVKAFNTLWSKTLAEKGEPDAPRDRRIALLVAGDDAEAKRTVSELVEQIGFAAVDTGGLADGERRQGPGSPLYNTPVSVAEAEKQLAG